MRKFDDDNNTSFFLSSSVSFDITDCGTGKNQCQPEFDKEIKNFSKQFQ